MSAKGMKPTLLTQEVRNQLATVTGNVGAAIAICGLVGLSSQSECGGVSTFHKAQEHIQAKPSQSSTLSPPNSATVLKSLPKAEQTFQQATQVHPSRLYANQGWPRHRPDKPSNTPRNPAFVYFSTPVFEWFVADKSAS